MLLWKSRKISKIHERCFVSLSRMTESHGIETPSLGPIDYLSPNFSTGQPKKPPSKMRQFESWWRNLPALRFSDWSLVGSLVLRAFQRSFPNDSIFRLGWFWLRPFTMFFLLLSASVGLPAMLRESTGWWWAGAIPSNCNLSGFLSAWNGNPKRRRIEYEAESLLELSAVTSSKKSYPFWHYDQLHPGLIHLFPIANFTTRTT